MSDRAAFLAHIADHPDADLPRLVFADWLDEQGDPLGEFIRVQIELHHLQDRLGDEYTQRLLAREDELMAEHREEWSFGWELRFERGLPNLLRLHWENYVFNVGRLLGTWPTLRVVSGLFQDLEDVPVAAVLLQKGCDLHLEGWPDLTGLDVILRAPYWNPNATLRLNTTLEGRTNFLPDIRDDLDRVGRLELVQPYSGPPVGRSARLIDETVEGLVADLNRSAGRDFAVLIRPYERWYPLLGDLGGNFFAGHLKSGAAVLFAITPLGRRAAFCTFTDTGRVDKSLWEDTSGPPWTLERIRDRFGFELGFIRVREFEANNRLAVRFWGSVERSVFADGTEDEWPEIADHLADPKRFTVSFDQREIAVSYRTSKAFAAK